MGVIGGQVVWILFPERFPCHKVEGIFGCHSTKLEFNWWYAGVIVEGLVTPFQSVA